MSDIRDVDGAEYREIRELVGYRFGDDGTIWSRWQLRHHILTECWRLLACHKNRRGYLAVKLSRYSRTSSQLVHQLILTAFVGPNPPGMGGCHKDGDPTNNRISNLYWGTQASNTADSMAHGTFKPMRGGANGNAKLNEDDIRSIFRLKDEGWSQSRIADHSGVTKTCIRLILQRKSWAHLEIT